MEFRGVVGVRHFKFGGKLEQWREKSGGRNFFAIFLGIVLPWSCKEIHTHWK